MHDPTPDARLPWADAHNHLHDPRLASLLDDNGVGDCPCLINATSEDDWDAVLETAARAPGTRHAALGVHPWFAHLSRPGWETRLRDQLKIRPDITIGECGLDGKTEACPLETQLPIFETQLRLARELDRPMTIHCVAAWGRLFDCISREPPPSRWMIHGFSGSRESALRLISLGAWLSIPVRALHPNGQKILTLFSALPHDRILLETDAPHHPPPTEFITHPLPGALNHPANLASIGSSIASRLGCDSRSFARQTHQNFQAFLGRLSQTGGVFMR